MSLDKKIDAVFSEMDEKSFRWGGLETYSLTRPLAKEKIRTLITAEIIAELERLHDTLSLEAREAGACDTIHKRVNELKAKENQL